MEAEVGVMLTPRKVAQRDVVEVESPAALKVLASLSEAQAQAQIHTSGYKSSFSNASTTYFHSSAADLLAEAAAAADAISTDSSEYDENDDVDDREPILFTTDIANAGAEMIKVRENTKSSSEILNLLSEMIFFVSSFLHKKWCWGWVTARARAHCTMPGHVSAFETRLCCHIHLGMEKKNTFFFQKV